jgi:hypothetical protein
MIAWDIQEEGDHGKKDLMKRHGWISADFGNIGLQGDRRVR